jgi:hypothetical protein
MIVIFMRFGDSRIIADETLLIAGHVVATLGLVYANLAIGSHICRGSALFRPIEEPITQVDLQWKYWFECTPAFNGAVQLAVYTPVAIFAGSSFLRHSTSRVMVSSVSGTHPTAAAVPWEAVADTRTGLYSGTMLSQISMWCEFR